MTNRILEFCELYCSSTFIPITCYDKNNRLIRSFHSLQIGMDIHQSLLSSLMKVDQNPGTYTSHSLGYYGLIRCGDEMTLIIGPVFNNIITGDTVRAFMQECVIPIEYLEDAFQFLARLPRLTYHQLLNVLVFLHFSLNNATIDLVRHFEYAENTAARDVPFKHAELSYSGRENPMQHDTYQFERQMLHYIEQGKTEQLQAFLLASMKSQPLREGALADSPLRQAKNIVIGLVTMVGKVAAIGGGLDVEQVYSLIDIYTQECERLATVDAVTNLQYHMLLDFSRRVEEYRLPDHLSPLTFNCIQFVNRHVNEKIDIDSVAQHVRKSRSYVSDAFKKDTGSSLGQYITHCKLSEAQNLLRYSNKSVLDVSNYLCFSSQSYFITVFKKAYNMTPKQYRETATRELRQSYREPG